jgi:hypothetical protein
MKICIPLAEVEEELLDFIGEGCALLNDGYEHYRDATGLPGKRQEWEQRILAYLGKVFPTPKEAGQFRDTPVTISPFPGMNRPVQEALNSISARLNILGSIVKTLEAEYHFEPESWNIVVPELEWSEQSPHIRTLFRSWRLGDGYDEAKLQAAEARLGVRLPAKLRDFYLAWGRRRDLTKTLHPLLPPHHLQLRGDVLEFWVENQAVVLWGIRCEQLEEADPPVVEAWNLEEGLEWTPYYARLSNFLDDMTYQNALFGGALYRGHTAVGEQTPQQIRWLEEHWRKARVGPTALEGDPDDAERPTIYIREGQAVSWMLSGWWAAAGSAEALDEIAQALQITWQEPYEDQPW